MKRMITKQMRDSFKVSAGCRIRKWMNSPAKFQADSYFNSTKKQRILILRRTVKL